MKLSWLMGCNAALYLTLHESGPERWGRWGAGRSGVPGPRDPVCLPGHLGQGSGRRAGRKGPCKEGRNQGQASLAEQHGAQGTWGLECHTPRGAQAAINLKSLGILLAFSKYY